jgi:hypothetical protein
MDNMWSAFNKVTEAFNVESDFVTAHSTMGKTKWFKGYTASVSHVSASHSITSSFHWDDAYDAALRRV